MFTYWANFLTTDVNKGNDFLSIINATFNYGRPVFPNGTIITVDESGPFTSVQANNTESGKYVGFPVQQSHYELLIEFLGNGPFVELNAKGVTDEKIAEFKEVLQVQTGNREILENNWRNFVEILGYTTP